MQLELEDIADVMAGLVRDATAPLVAANEALAAENKALSERLAAVETRELLDVSSFCDAEAVSGMIADAISGLQVQTEEFFNEGVTANFAKFAPMVDALEAQFNERLAEATEGIAKSDELLAQLGSQIEAIANTQELLASIGEEIRELRERAPEKGDPGEVDMDVVKALVDEAVWAKMAALPPPEKGEKGDRGESGEKGDPGKDGANGKDGLGLANALKDSDGCLILTMTDGSTRNLGRIDGKDGETFTLDDFDIEPIDERSIKLKFTKGEVCHSFEFEFPVPIYRGVFSENTAYTRGDMVTWAGSQWHCDEPKGLKPGEPESGWSLSVKKGRDGKDAGK